MPICYPPDTDWGCAFTTEDIAAMRANPSQRSIMERSEAFAWGTLAALTAYRIGVCPVVVRPCAQRCAPQGTWMEAVVTTGADIPVVTIGRSFTPHMEGGEWVNSCGCVTASSCGCSTVSEVILPGPVGHIVSVKVDGVVLPQAAYRVDNGNLLVRQDGGTWPLTQDLNEREGAFTVEYYRGAAPNEITRYAAGVLAAEFYKGCTSGKCRLPRGTVNVQRRGVSYEMEPDFMKSLSSWPEIAPVIAMFNPYQLKTAPRVLSPDSRSTPRRQTWGTR